jgi:hypothetical protein
VTKRAWWENAESKRYRLGRWEFYRDRRDWWIGIFFAGDKGTYFGFLTLIAKRRCDPPLPSQNRSEQ